MSVSHSFSVEVACVVGDRKATILNNFSHWHLKNGQDGHNVYDGHVWTYNSIAGFAKVWPYLTEKQIRTCLDALVENGYLKTGNYNEWKSDQTKWYALTEKGCELMKIPFSVELAHLPKKANAFDQKGKSNCPNGQNDLPEKADGFDQTGKPLPLQNTLIKPLENPPPQPDENSAESEAFIPSPLPKEAIVIGLKGATQIIEKHRTDILNAPISKDRECKKLHISPDYYDLLTNGFFDKQLSDAERKVPIEFYRMKSHFDNWIRKQVKLGSESSYHPRFQPVGVGAPVAGMNQFVSQLQASTPD